MAAEQSYARLGFFLVVVLVVVLATALLFIQRLRSRDVIEAVTYTTENVSGLEVSSPVRYRGVSIGRISEVRVDPRDVIVEINFEMFPDRLNTIGVDVERIRQMRDLSGMFPRLRASRVSNPVTGEAYLLLDVPEKPPPPMTLGFTPDAALCSVDAHGAGDGAGPTAGNPGQCGSDAAHPRGDRQQGSREPRPEQSILYQRRAHRSGKPAPGVERRFTEVLLDHERPDRQDRDRSQQSDRRRRNRWSRSLRMPTPRSRRPTSPPRTSQRVPRRTRPRWPPTICGARCRPFAIRSINCAISLGNYRSSRSRSCMAHALRQRSHDSCDRLRIASPRRDDLSGRNGLPVEAARDDTGPHDRAAIAGATARTACRPGLEQRRRTGSDPSARYAIARAHRPPGASSTA